MKINPAPIQVTPLDHSSERSSHHTAYTQDSPTENQTSQFWSKQSQSSNSTYQQAQTYTADSARQEQTSKGRFLGLIQIIAGLILIFIGIPMLILPGPGILSIGAGIALILMGSKNLVAPKKPKVTQ